MWCSPLSWKLLNTCLMMGSSEGILYFALLGRTAFVLSQPISLYVNPWVFMLSPSQFFPSPHQGGGGVSSKLCGASAPTGITPQQYGICGSYTRVMFYICFLQAFGVKQYSPVLIWATAPANCVENDTVPTKANKLSIFWSFEFLMGKEFFLPLN